MENIVALVGRPNVGKSTLFNRFIQTKKAIISHTEGTTRDRHYGVAEWCGGYFTLIDTGGYVANSEDIFAQQVAAQVGVAIQEASVMLLVVDCKQGLVGLDRDVARVLRRSGKPVLVVANKADNPRLTAYATEFYALGFDTLYTVSATHGTGTGDLLDAVIAHFDKPSTISSSSEIPKIAIIGRPNVGKSTFLNALLNQERSVVTPIAHTTRSPIHSYYNLYGKRLMLVDTAGMRRKAQVKEALEFYSVMRTLKAMHQADVCTLLINAEDGLTNQDQQIIDLVYAYKKGLVILVNKWDLITKDHKVFLSYRKDLLKQLGNRQDIPILFTSGLNKKNIYQGLEKALQVYENRAKRIPTAELNNVVLKAISQFLPPVTKNKIVKIKYITQLPTTTPTFAFFCNLPQYLPNAYKQYLENQLQKHFNFQGVPITMVFKKK